jgi:Tfp pilus assembly protein PilO
MKLSATNKMIVAMVALAVLCIAFWMAVLGPKRQEASDLGVKVEELKASLAQHEQEAAAALAARESFPTDYQQLVVLGKAVPGDDDTASLLVQLNRIAGDAGVTFRNLELSAAAGASAAPAPVPVAPATSGAVPGAAPASPTEVAAATLPLGAAIGPAGLAVMPYTLTFDGSFFQIADFIDGLDSLVKTTNENVTVDGRLITIDAFSLASDPADAFPALQATFSVTTYLTPPAQGVAAGATPIGPAPATATPVATTTGVAP